MFKSEVFKSWSLVLQLGISMLVPIFMLVAIGHLVKIYTKIDLMLIFVLLGVAVGIRNVYVILRNYLKSMDSSENKESELMNKHLNTSKIISEYKLI